MTTVKYGIEQSEMQECREALKIATLAGGPDNAADWFGYYMAQLAQTYQARKVMYTVK